MDTTAQIIEEKIEVSKKEPYALCTQHLLVTMHKALFCGQNLSILPRV